jgi:hypothetical protein
MMNMLKPYCPEVAMPVADITRDADTYNKFITTRVLLPRGDTLKKAVVTRHKRDSSGQWVGHAHSNPLLDTRVYEVTFLDGGIGEYATKFKIVENIFATIDDDGFETLLFKEIIGH